jgi:isoamylase
LWTEWNGKYRDTVRDFWRGQPATLPEFASRLTGSSDLYETSGRRPVASINFVTCHDGFTLADLVSYNGKHNEANGEDNRDGTDDNRSWNCGVEGPAEDPAIIELRGRQQRNFLTTLFLSQGIPMMLAGDEISRTQGGNNNAYCQDNEISWVDWSRVAADRDLLVFTQKLARLRRHHPVFRRRRFFQGAFTSSADKEGADKESRGTLGGDIAWLTPAGDEMTEKDWQASYAKSVAVFLNGAAISEPDPRGDPVTDQKFLLLFNAGAEPITFTLPEAKLGGDWEVVIDTVDPRGDPADAIGFLPRTKVQVDGRAIVVLRSKS